MKFTITIIEDKEDAKEQLLTALDIWKEKNNVYLQIEYFCNGENYFASHVTDESTLYILDIQLHGMDGIEIAQKMRARGYNGNILFLSAFQEYVFRGYDVRAFHYLLKPVSQIALNKCLDEIYSELYGNCFIYRNADEIIQIPFHKIITISIVKHYVDITTTEKIYACRLSLKEILRHLPTEFIQCHRSYIINMRHIQKIAGTTITMSNRTLVTVGRNYLDTVRHQYSDFCLRLYVPFEQRTAKS